MKDTISVFTRRLRVSYLRLSVRVRIIFENLYCIVDDWTLIGLSITWPIASIDRTLSFRHAGLMTFIIMLRELRDEVLTGDAVEFR